MRSAVVVGSGAATVGNNGGGSRQQQQREGEEATTMRGGGEDAVEKQKAIHATALRAGWSTTCCNRCWILRMIPYTQCHPHVVSKVNGLFYSPFFCYTIGGSGTGGISGVDGCGISGRGWWKAGGGVGEGKWEAGGGGMGRWEAGGGGSESNGGGRQRKLMMTGSVGQRWTGEDRGSGCLGVAVVLWRWH